MGLIPPPPLGLCNRKYSRACNNKSDLDSDEYMIFLSVVHNHWNVVCSRIFLGNDSILSVVLALEVRTCFSKQNFPRL